MQIEDILQPKTTPLYLKEASKVYMYLQSLSMAQLQLLYKANDKITMENYTRLHTYQINKPISAALFSYHGIQYKYMGCHVMDETSQEYLQKHLFILSAIYGILRPFDGIIPYRLELGSGCKIQGKSLYEYFSEVTRKTFEKEECIINLASEEYAKLVRKNICENTLFIDIKFYQNVNGKWKSKATDAKMARGRMVAFMARENISNKEQIKQFHDLNYTYNEKLSNEYCFVFTKKEENTH